MNIGTCLSLEIGSRMPRDWFENGTIVAYFLHKQKSLPASRLCQHIAETIIFFVLFSHPRNPLPILYQKSRMLLLSQAKECGYCNIAKMFV